MKKDPPESYISYCLHAAETLIDSLQLMKYCRANRKVHYRLRKALGFIRRVQSFFPQQNYSLYRWIIPHEDERAKLLRFQWRKYKRLKALEKVPKLEEFLDAEE